MKGNVIIGNIVLIKNGNLSPAKLSLGRIIDTINGSDATVRGLKLSSEPKTQFDVL